jgi:hypothetical protein
MAYSKFPEKQRKPTGVRWWTGKDGRQFVEFGNGDDTRGSVYLVVSNTDTDSGLTDRKNRPVVWPSIRTLALAGGPPNAVVYACADCDYAAPHHYQVRPHRNAHRKAKPQVAELSGAMADLKQLIQNSSAAERRIERLTRDRDEWKRRATAAEGDLTALHKALGRLRVTEGQS